MVCATKQMILFLLSGLAVLVNATEIKELATKQPINNIRYLSADGQFTYFQNSRGKLFFASNYNLFTILERKPHTNYTITASNYNNFLIIAVQEDFFRHANFMADYPLYLLRYGKHRASKLGRGQNIRFHQQGKWASFYNHLHHTIELINLEATLIHNKIKIKNSVFPYFLPEILMFNDKHILYSDIDKKGHEGILHYNRATNKKKLLYISQKIGEHLQLCQNNQYIFILSSGQTDLKTATTIWQLDKKQPLQTRYFKEIYSSRFNDIGNMVCDLTPNTIYFVKTQAPTKYTAAKNIVVSLSLPTKKIQTIYQQDGAFTLYRLNNKLMINTHGKQLVLIGNSQLKSDKIE